MMPLRANSPSATDVDVAEGHQADPGLAQEADPLHDVRVQGELHERAHDALDARLDLGNVLSLEQAGQGIRRHLREVGVLPGQRQREAVPEQTGEPRRRQLRGQAELGEAAREDAHVGQRLVDVEDDQTRTARCLVHVFLLRVVSRRLLSTGRTAHRTRPGNTLTCPAGSHNVPEPRQDVAARAAAEAFHQYVQPQLDVLHGGAGCCARGLATLTSSRSCTASTVSGDFPSWSCELNSLPGRAHSSPARIDNGAAEQSQLDVYGDVMDAMHQARRTGMATDADAWALQR
jgi:hypothetical protein